MSARSPLKKKGRLGSALQRSKLWRFLSGMGKPAAVVAILLLAAADVFAVQELFGRLNTDPVQKFVYSFTFAACLEGLPTFMGNCTSKLFDSANYKKNDLIIAIGGLIVSLAGLIFAFFVSYNMRLSLINSYGGAEAFAAGTYGQNVALVYQPEQNSVYLKDWFLLWSPFVTSLLAFVISWTALPSDTHGALERELDRLYLQYLEAEYDYRTARNTMEMAKVSLWKDLADSEADMPRPIHLFRKACYERIHNALDHDCLQKYPNELRHYNAELTGELMNILRDMAKRTTIPEQIANIDIDALLKTYDAGCTNRMHCWDCDQAEEPMRNDLKELLGNAIAAAQIRSAAGYGEGSNFK